MDIDPHLTSILEVAQKVPSDAHIYYRVIQDLGVGGNSCVYLVEALTGPYRGVLFALKLFLQIGDKTRQGRFLKEIAFLRKCEHPAIMRVYDVGRVVVPTGEESKEYPFVIADYLPQTLRRAILGGALSMPEKLASCLQLLSGLSYLSAQTPQAVHRDIKPENIFVRGKSFLLPLGSLLKLNGPSAIFHMRLSD